MNQIHPDRLLAAEMAAIMQRTLKKEGDSLAGEAIRMLEACRDHPKVSQLEDLDATVSIARMAATIYGRHGLTVEEAIKDAWDIFHDVMDHTGDQIGGSTNGQGW